MDENILNFEENKIKKLKLFHKRILQLKENDGFLINTRVNLKSSKENGSTAEYVGPDKKTVKAFLVDFRPFVLNDEPVNFDHISNIIIKSISSGSIKEETLKTKKVWNEILDRKDNSPTRGMSLQIDGKTLLSNKNLDLWLNANFFHTDEKKQELLTYINNNPLGQISYFLFISLVQDLTQLLFWFDNNVIKPILGDKDES
ncbi:MAG: hypothetical protein PHX34_03925 [Candidatus Shapirobacteria bacterium]|jgi:hypothetical protein|nr:hypothetical protein [Candidatus Shapirobacteria bacterium]